MGEERIQISIPHDSEGFFTLRCPYCGQRFKLSSGEVESSGNGIDVYCPYCGLQGHSSRFIDTQVLEAAHVQVTNIAQQAINRTMRDLERSMRGNKHVKFKPGKPLRPLPEKELYETDDLEIVTLSCCEKRVKVEGLEAEAGIYCPYCGESQ